MDLTRGLLLPSYHTIPNGFGSPIRASFGGCHVTYGVRTVCTEVQRTNISLTMRNVRPSNFANSTLPFLLYFVSTERLRYSTEPIGDQSSAEPC